MEDQLYRGLPVKYNTTKNVLYSYLAFCLTLGLGSSHSLTATSHSLQSTVSVVHGTLRNMYCLYLTTTLSTAEKRLNAYERNSHGITAVTLLPTMYRGFHLFGSFLLCSCYSLFLPQVALPTFGIKYKSAVNRGRYRLVGIAIRDSGLHLEINFEHEAF